MGGLKYFTAPEIIVIDIRTAPVASSFQDGGEGLSFYDIGDSIFEESGQHNFDGIEL